MQHVYILRNNNTNHSLGRKVKKCQIIVIRGHMVKNSKEGMSHMISLGVLGCLQRTFDMQHAYIQVILNFSNFDVGKWS